MDNTTVGNYIRMKLKEKGISQESLAERLGITPSAVSQNLSGKSSFEIQNLVIIAEILEDTLDNIVRAGEKKESELERKVKLGLKEILNFEKSGQSLKEKDIYNNTALDYAIRHQNVEVFKHLVDRHLYGEGVSKNPLFLAFLIHHNLEEYLTRQYVDYSLDLSMESTHSLTKIEFPSFFNNRDYLFDIIQKGDSIIGKLSPQGLILIDSILGCRNSNILNRIPYLRQQRNWQTSDSTYAILAVTIERDDLVNFNRIKDLSRMEIDDKMQLYAIKRKSVEITKAIVAIDRTGQYIKNLVESNDASFFAKFYTGGFYHEHYLIQALINAVNIENHEIIQLILSKCSTEVKNAALNAIQTDKLSIIKLFLEHGAMFTYRESEGGKLIPQHSLTNTIKCLLIQKDK